MKGTARAHTHRGTAGARAEGRRALISRGSSSLTTSLTYEDLRHVARRVATCARPRVARETARPRAPARGVDAAGRGAARPLSTHHEHGTLSRGARRALAVCPCPAAPLVGHREEHWWRRGERAALRVQHSVCDAAASYSLRRTRHCMRRRGPHSHPSLTT